MSFVIDTPEGIEMFGLLAARGRLHIEMSGLKFRQSTLAALQRAGITTKRTRKGALADLNAYIEARGGPADSHHDRPRPPWMGSDKPFTGDPVSIEPMGDK